MIRLINELVTIKVISKKIIILSINMLKYYKETIFDIIRIVTLLGFGVLR